MKVLIVSPVPTDPPTAGNRARVSNLLSALESLGHHVSFAYAPYEDFDAGAMWSRLHHRLHILKAGKPPFPLSGIIAKAKRRIARSVRLSSSYLSSVDEWFDDQLLPQIKGLHEVETFEVALIVYVFMSKVISVFPKSVRTIIDANDLMGDRHRNYLNAGLQPQWFSTKPKQEIQALNRANAVIAIQEGEADYFRRHVSSEVFCVGHIPPPNAKTLPDSRGARLLFVGSANPINIQGLEWFIAAVLPKIQADMPNCELAIAGPAGRERRWPNGVIALGQVESLEKAYAEATVIVNPVLFGTGLAVKSIEALGFGKPLVTTTAGARGLGAEFSSALSIAQNENEFAQSVLRLLQNKAERNELSGNGLAAVHTWRRRQLANLDAAIRGKTNGHSKNCPCSSSATNLPANDSASFSLSSLLPIDCSACSGIRTRNDGTF
jgi:glycosyltransferase involved in cell wall biosynthesis